MKCDICGRVAIVHSTEITGGKTSERHLCEAHAELSLASDFTGMLALGIDRAPVPDSTWRGMVDNLRGIVNSIKRHGRPPSLVAELEEGKAMESGVPTAEIMDAKLKATLDYMDRFIDFCEQHQRLPKTPEEWAPFIRSTS
jgi:hypothetical protein